MDDLTLLIQSTQQVCMGIMLLLYSQFFLTEDLDRLRENLSANNKRFLSTVFITFALGIFYVFNNEWGMSGIFYSIEFTLLIILAIIHPKYAAGLLVYLLLSRPWETANSQLLDSMPRDMSYLVILSIAAHKILNKKYYFRFNAGTLLLVALSIWLFLSGFFSNHSSLAFSKFKDIYLKAIVIFLLIQNSMDIIKDAYPVKIALIMSILEKGFISLYTSYNADPNAIEGESERLVSVGILENSNDIAAIFILVLPFVVFFLLKTKLRPFSWLLSIGAFALLSNLVWQTQSRGSVIALLICLSSYLVLKVKSKKILTLGFVFAIVGSIGMIQMMKRSASDLEGSTSNRIIFWKAGANMAIRNPVFGVGFWGFNRNFQAYAIGGDTGSEKTNMTAHSSWVLVLAESGFMGLFLFVALWAYTAYRAWLLRNTEPEYFMSLAGYAVAISFLSHTYLLFPYILLGLVISHSKLDDVVLDYNLHTKVL
jgi:putative inorganic carbon (HCO3(-)) transporter